MKTFKLLILIIIIALNATAQLTTTNTLTPQQLVQQVLLGTGVTASNITYSVGSALQISRFNATANTNLGILNGILLSTGNANSSSPNGPQGPNNGTGLANDTEFSGPGDANLDALSGVTTNDAAILEFDFTPTGDSVKFRYCFGSEEYPEYVGGGVNDAFGFFLSGPNPNGGSYTNKNIALIPGTATPVAIDNVNATTNSTYYRNNSTNTINCEFDGFTTVLYALEKVICGQTYHIKIAIADGGDDAVDSGVFLEGGSFSSLPPLSLNTNNASALIQDTLFYEDCNTYCITFNRNQNISVKDSFLLNVSGNATNGLDYGTLTGTTISNVIWPTNLVFPAGSPTVSICSIKVLDDGLIEGLDTLRFTISKYTTSTTSCVQTNTVSFSIYLSDYTPVNIIARDSNICNSQAITINTQSSNGKPPYTYSWSPGSSTTNSITTSIITEPTNYTITVNDICNHPISKEIKITPSILPVLSLINDYQFCLDTIKQIPFFVSGGELPNTFSWVSPTNGIAPFDTINNIYYVQQNLTPSSGTYSIVVTDKCNLTDTVTFNIKTYDCHVYVPNVVTANGDGVNDVFKINALENFPDNKLVVFNRWGKQVHSVSNYKNDWKPDNSAGTYYYVLTLADGRTYNGFFQLIKD